MIGYTAWFIVTAYSWGCGATGNVAVTNKPPTPFYTVAVDRNVIHGGALLELDAPFVRGRTWYAEDTGGCSPAHCVDHGSRLDDLDTDMVGHRLDIMVATCDQARWWGRRRVRARVVGIIRPRNDTHTDEEHGLGK